MLAAPTADAGTGRPTGRPSLRREDGADALLAIAASSGGAARTAGVRTSGSARDALHAAAYGWVKEEEVQQGAAAAAVPIDGGRAATALDATRPCRPRHHQQRDRRPTASPIEAMRPIGTGASWGNVAYILPRKPLPLPDAIATS